MNGELNTLYQQLKTDLKVMQARYEERWDSHDTRSTELREQVNDLQGMIDKLNIECMGYFSKLENKIAKLPCNTHMEKWKGLSARIAWLYAMFGSVIIFGIVLGLWVKGVTAP